MADSQVPRMSLEAERSVIGAAMIRPARIPEDMNLIDPRSFFNPRYAAVWSVLVQMYRSGDTIDAVTVYDQLRKGSPSFDNQETLTMLYETQQEVGSLSGHYAKIIAEHALARDLQQLCGGVAFELYDYSADAGQQLDLLRERLSSMGVANMGEMPPDVFSVDQWLERTEEDRSPWVIPGLLREKWRAIMVASEGMGKTVLFRQLAMCVGQGVHPLTYKDIDPHITLMLDLENPGEAIDEQIALVHAKLRRHRGDKYEPQRTWLWTRPAGINIRARHDRAEFEALIAQARPGLVCISPLYKLFRITSGDNEDRATLEVQEILGDLMHRYGFALLIEHHAPKGNFANRDIFPSGSSHWLKWPEFGLGFVPVKGADEGIVWDVDRWRGDRLQNSWPDRISRGRPGEWPWGGIWLNPASSPSATEQQQF